MPGPQCLPTRSDHNDNGLMALRPATNLLHRVSGVLFACFVLTCGGVLWAGELPGDRGTVTSIHRAAGERGEDLSATVADQTDLWPLAVVAAVVLAWLLWARRRTDAVRFCVAVGFVWAVNPLLKDLFARDRPDLPSLPDDLSPHSLPSGHAANTAALVCALVMVTWHTRWRVPVLALGAFLLVLVGVTQLALGVHYPSDVLAGWLWAGAWVAFVASRPVPARTNGQS